MKKTTYISITVLILALCTTGIATGLTCEVPVGRAKHVGPGIQAEQDSPSDYVAKQGEPYTVWIVSPTDTPVEVENRVNIKAKDIDYYDNSEASESCIFPAHMLKINWGDDSGWVAPQNILRASHVYEAGTGCGSGGGKIPIRIQFMDAGSLVTDPTSLYVFDINVTASDECGGCSTDGCSANACNLSAYFYTDPSGGPSGVYYTSHPFDAQFITQPFGSYTDAHNRGWRLLEDRHAGLTSDVNDDYIILTAGGKLVERLIEVGGKYYSETTDATGVFASGAVTIYRNEKNTEYYGDQITANVDYAITSATDSLGRVTTWTYTTDTTPPKKRLATLTLPGTRIYSYTWAMDSYINRYLLERIVSPDGFRLKFGVEPLSPGVDRMRVARRVDQNNSDLIFEETYFTHSTTSGETHLITQYARNELVNGSLTSVFQQYTAFDYASHGGRVTQNQEITTAGTLTVDNAYEVTGYEPGSSQTTLQDGTTRRYLLTNLSPALRRIVRETRDEFFALITSSTELHDRVHGVILASTDIHGATRSYVYNFNPTGDAKHLLIRDKSRLGYKHYWYDDDNRLVAQRSVAVVGGGTETVSFQTTEYDGEDRAASTSQYIGDNTLQTVTVYVYDSEGNPTRTLTYDADDVLLTESSSQYASNGFILSSTDAEGRRTYYGYNGDYQMTEVGINNATTTMDYDVHGRLVERVSPLGNTTEYDYTPVGQTRRVTQYLDMAGAPVAVTTTFDYDNGGYGKRLTAVRDAKNQKTGYVYNPWGRLAAEVIYEGTTSHTVKAKGSYHYDAMGRVLSATSFSRIPTTFEYDDLGRLKVKQIWNNDPLIPSATTSVKITNIYNDLGQLSSVEIDDASGCGCEETKSYTYDAHGRMSGHTGVVEDSDLSYTYDDFGQLAGFDYPNDPASWASKSSLDYVYDVLGRMDTVDDGAKVDPLAKYRYNKASEITDVTYANGARTVYDYDSYGRVAAVVNHATDDTVMSSFRYSYNLDGLRTRVDREDGAVHLYEYDTLNRLTRERKIAGFKSLCLEFDGSNDFVVFADPYNPSVDGESELTVEAWIKTGSNVSSTQDVIAKPSPFTLSIGSGHFVASIKTTEDTYSCQGTATLSTNTWYHLALVYDAGDEEMRIYVNGELDGTAEALFELDGDSAMFFGAGSTNGFNANQHFFGGRLDEVRISNVARDVETLWDNGIYAKELSVDGGVALFHINEGSNTTTYNAGPAHYAGMLGWSGGNPQWIVEDAWANRFDYDKVGNRTKWGKYVISATTTYNYSYNTLNQLTKMTAGSLTVDYKYDVNGNRIKKQDRVSSSVMGTVYYRWDQDDHLIQARFVDSSSDTAKTVDYHYCRTCSGSRTEKIVKDEYGFITERLRYEMEGLNHLRIDEKWDSDDDDDLDDNDLWRVQRVYYNGPGQLGQIVKATVWDYTSTPTPTDYYYGYDILGNVSVISNNSGTEVDQFEQDAFGNEVEGSWTSPVGGITEHLTTKQYDADLGLYYFNARWYDVLSGGFLSKDKKAQLAKYTFSRNRPTTFVDPTGWEPIIQAADGRCDLKFGRCSDRTPDCIDYSCCSKRELEKFTLSSTQQALNALNCIASGDPTDPACGTFAPPPSATCNEIRSMAGGVTITDSATGMRVPYYNPDKGDSCTQACTCLHEYVHVLQGESAIVNNVDRAARELPAYMAGSACGLYMLAAHGSEMKP